MGSSCPSTGQHDIITQPPVKPGESYTYQFTVPNAGSRGTARTTMPPSRSETASSARSSSSRGGRSRRTSRDGLRHGLNDGAHGYTLNGKGFPATEPVVCRSGQPVRIRFMNEGMMIHPMHLHGMHMTVIAKDGWDQPARWNAIP